jgi:hypothetical protein
MARKGKIARLPFVIRDEVNRHLKNNKPSKKIVDWLNGLPEVQQILHDEFDGAPINERNLSNWRKGGFIDSQEALDVKSARRIIMEAHPALIASVQGGLSDRIAVLFAAHMLKEWQSLDSVTDTKEKAVLWRELRLGLAAMRRYEYYTAKYRAEFGEMEQERLEKARAEESCSPEEEEQKIRGILGIPASAPRWDEEKECYVGEGADGLNEQHRKIVAGELYADNPVYEDWREEGRRAKEREATVAT